MLFKVNTFTFSSYNKNPMQELREKTHVQLNPHTHQWTVENVCVSPSEGFWGHVPWMEKNPLLGSI